MSLFILMNRRNAYTARKWVGILTLEPCFFFKTIKQALQMEGTKEGKRDRRSNERLVQREGLEQHHDMGLIENSILLK